MAELSNNACRFAAEIAWLQEAARYFSKRPTGGEDAAHWSNVYNAENANKIASHLDALSRAPAPMEAVAWRAALTRQCDNMAFILNHAPVGKWYEKFTAELEEDLQALAVIPTQGFGSSSPKSEDTHRAAEKAVVVPKEPSDEMLEAACAVGPDTNSGPFSYDDAREVFVAMIGAVK